jgi:signal transduction histidine kinase
MVLFPTSHEIVAGGPSGCAPGNCSCNFRIHLMIDLGLRASRSVDPVVAAPRRIGTEIPVARTKTDIASLCREIADELRAINPDRRFEVTHQGDPVGSCDPARLGQVLSNLMGNAIQYGDVSSPITVRVAGNDPETVTITVHNLGTPIPMETQKVIFQSWMRGQDVKNPPEQGTHLGLGLYIAN